MKLQHWQSIASKKTEIKVIALQTNNKYHYSRTTKSLPKPKSITLYETKRKKKFQIHNQSHFPYIRFRIFIPVSVLLASIDHRNISQRFFCSGPFCQNLWTYRLHTSGTASFCGVFFF